MGNGKRGEDLKALKPQGLAGGGPPHLPIIIIIPRQLVLVRLKNLEDWLPVGGTQPSDAIIILLKQLILIH